MSDLRTTQKKVTIASAATVSSAAACQGYTLVAISIPAAFTGATLTFQGDIDGGETYQAIVDTTGAAVTWTLGGVDRIIVPKGGDALIGGLVNIKVVSGGAEAADRTLTLHFVRTEP